MDEFEPTHRHYGALLIAVGTVMMRNGVSAVAARAGHYDADLVRVMVKYGLPEQEAEHMLQVDLSMAINMQ